MDVRINYIYLFVVFSFIAACSNAVREKENEKKYSLTEKLIFSDSINTIVINNPADHAVSFTLNINNGFPLTMDKLLKNIRESKLPYPQSAWYYVKMHSFYSRPFSHENWQHIPELFLNSLGGGLCDDRASVLAYIIKSMGDSVRVMGLNGHVVTEIFYNNKWQMFDTDNGVFYCDKNNTVFSVNELEKQPDRIKNPRSFCDEKLINPVFIFSNATTTRFAEFYASADDNIDITDWHIPNYKCDSQFVLPSYSSLKIVFNQNHSMANFEVELNQTSKGELKIPLIPLKAKGQFIFSNENKTVHVTDTNFIFPSLNLIRQIDIEEVKSTSKIYYIVNPKLQISADTNYFEITASSKIDFIQQRTEAKSVVFSPAFLFFDTIQNKYPTFYSELVPIKANESIDDYLLRQYLAFLKTDSTLQKQKVNELFMQFKLDINTLLQSEVEYKNLIEKHYPRSVFYFFTASKHKQMDYLREILNDSQ